MTPYQKWIAFYTLLRKEVLRFSRMWTQTLLPPVITASLYFLIFGHFIGARIGTIDNIPYLDFIVPGLIMMTVINSAFANVVFSFYIAKFQREIEELLVSPMPLSLIIAGYVMGGILRGLIAGAIVFATAMLFWHPQIYSFGILLLFALLTALVFALGGLLNAIFARKFDDITLFSTFILVPLTYLGGIFYSIEALPQPWQSLSRLNPILYMISGFRYGMYGIRDVHLINGIVILIFLATFLATANGYLLYRGFGVRE